MGLPLRMDNLHAPTVPSGPTTSTSTNGTLGHLTFAELQQKKDNIELELKALGGVLDSQRVDMETPLLTRDGFPRSDIDVAQIRTTRARIIRLRNDYKELMARAENFLHEHFANISDDERSQPVPPAASNIASADTHGSTLDEPFATVNSVAAGSPAERAGLRTGDAIRSFGYANKSNHDGLKRVGECVQGNEGQNIFIRVSRTSNVTEQQELRLTLTPVRNWGGRGMLGCHILPI